MTQPVYEIITLEIFESWEEQDFHFMIPGILEDSGSKVSVNFVGSQ